MDDIPKASNGYVELNGMRFLRPFEISLESKMISEHTFGGGMVFREEVDDSVFATIDMINIISSRMSDDSVGSSCLKEWQGEHVREVLGITKRYDKLAEKGFHRGVFQSIQSAWFNEEQTSALAKVCLPTSHRHKHDAFYLIHPALLDGVFQLSGLMINDDDGSMWVPSGIQRLIKYLPSLSFGKATNVDEEMWAYVRIKENTTAYKTFSIELCNSKGLLSVEVEDFRLAKLLPQAPKASLYTTQWIEIPNISKLPLGTSFQNKKLMEQTSIVEPLDMIKSYKIVIVELSGCIGLESKILEELDACSMKLSDILVLRGDEIPSVLLVPVMSDSDEDSCIVIEEGLSLLQFLSVNLKGDATSRCRLGFWTCNAEGPLEPIATINNEVNVDGKKMLSGGSIWGLVRTAALEINSRKISIVCIDTDSSLSEKDMIVQVGHELLVDDDNNMPVPEVAYRGKQRFERRLSHSSQPDIIKPSECEEEPSIGVSIITGGLGGLGLVTAETLVELGATHVVLISRSGKVKNYEGQDLQKRLNRLLEVRDGTAVSVECCDVCDEDAVCTFLKKVHEKYGRINTLIHASGVVDDGLIMKQNKKTIREVFEPKAKGAWFLHKHTLIDNLENFIVFSSVAALFGNIGQANYSASNAYIDTLIRYRRSLNYSGISIQWPGIADLGMAAAMNTEIRMNRELMLEISYVKMVLRKMLHSCKDVYIEPIQAPLVREILNEDIILPRLRDFTSSVII